MGIVKYNPFTPFKPAGFDNFFDDFFGRSLADFSDANFRGSTPSVNVIEKDESFVIEVAAPGMEKGDFNVEIDNAQLIISAERKGETEEKEEGKFTRREFNYTSFKRSFQLSDQIDTGKIDATYTDGILKINLGKKETAVSQAPKTINIS